METHPPIRVAKLGGSLLSLAGLGARLLSVLRGEQWGRSLIICGGGAAADIIRRWQPVHGLSDEQAHWLALRAVSMNELLLSHLLPDAVIVTSRDALRSAWRGGRRPILAVESFLRTEEPRAPEVLPHDWTATSDSIAAWVARQLGADRMLLCKSCDLPPGITPHHAAARTLVDRCFPKQADALAVDWVNLRESPPRVIPWWPSAEARQAAAGAPA